MHANASCILYFVLGFRIKYAVSVFGGFDENFKVEELSFPVHDVLSKFCTDCSVVSDWHVQDIMGRDIKTNIV